VPAGLFCFEGVEDQARQQAVPDLSIGRGLVEEIAIDDIFLPTWLRIQRPDRHPRRHPCCPEIKEDQPQWRNNDGARV
jgi:hypothetical protein